VEIETGVFWCCKSSMAEVNAGLFLCRKEEIDKDGVDLSRSSRVSSNFLLKAGKYRREKEGTQRF
jgi:hypothetical protein